MLYLVALYVSLPCIISLLVGALYNIVDQIFIANASYLGSYAFVSLALESTVLSVVREIVFGVGFVLLLPLKFELDIMSEKIIRVSCSI